MSLVYTWAEKRSLDFLKFPFYSILSIYIKYGELLSYLESTVASNQSDNII